MKKSRLVTAGDPVVVTYSEVHLGLEPQMMPLSVLYEDDDLLIITKEQGLVVHPGAGNWEGRSSTACSPATGLLRGDG